MLGVSAWSGNLNGFRSGLDHAGLEIRLAARTWAQEADLISDAGYDGTGTPVALYPLGSGRAWGRPCG
jgi:hypothetical protein